MEIGSGAYRYRIATDWARLPPGLALAEVDGVAVDSRDRVFVFQRGTPPMLVLDRDAAPESTGHGSPLPMLKHGGPGRAGGGEELGGIRAVKHYLQRCAVQASPTMLTAITGEYVRGGKVTEDAIHPFRKHFEEKHGERVEEDVLTAASRVGTCSLPWNQLRLGRREVFAAALGRSDYLEGYPDPCGC